MIYNEIKNSLNPQVIKVIQSKQMVGEGSKKRYVTYFHDFEGNLLGIGDPALCKTCLEFCGNYVPFCTSDHK
jgi:hypothetical protein